MFCSSPPSALIVLTRRAFISSSVFTRNASTRARNLAARHWELVQTHSPHPATQHVLEHEVTKATIMEHTGLKGTTDMLTNSVTSPLKDVYVRGVRIPQRPKPPEPDGEVQ
jgi:hypothetical protein